MGTNLSIAVFALTLLATLVASYLGHRHELRKRWCISKPGSEQMAGRFKCRHTANSGFVVTAAVGLGYTFGARWLLLSLGWLIGDLVFWTLFPQRINRTGTEAQATTLSDVLVFRVAGRARPTLKILIGLITLICLGGFVSAQWLAGQKFLNGAFGFESTFSLFVFAVVIIVYSALGGFRGSIYTDTLQAIIRIIGTIIAVAALYVVASRDPDPFWRNIHAAGPDFLQVAPDGFITALVFSLGFAVAAVGFGLGQPQIVTRYLAGASPKETQSAWWIYILFVQATSVSMTGFGIALRGVMPELADPETGLSSFHRATTGPIITGIIVADMFATIAATSNGILVAMAQSLAEDFIRPLRTNGGRRTELWFPIIILGAATMLLSLYLHKSVKDLALSAVGMMGWASTCNDDPGLRLAFFSHFSSSLNRSWFRNWRRLELSWLFVDDKRGGSRNYRGATCQPNCRTKTTPHRDHTTVK